MNCVLFFIKISLTWIISITIGCHSREINFIINPNCKSNCTVEQGCNPASCDDPWLIYGKGDSGNNSIHYLWSFMELPTFVMASSENNSEIIIDWPMFMNGTPDSITFSSPPNSFFGISFQSLILFNDVNDTGTLNNVPDDFKKTVSLSDFQWTLKENNSSEEYAFTFGTQTFRNKPFNDNDTGIDIKVTSYGTSGRSSTLPHLITTSDSAQVQITLNNLVFNDTFISNIKDQQKYVQMPIGNFSYPRWALDMIILSSDGPENLTYTADKSLDDEHTPGVFDLNSIASHSALNFSPESYEGGYLQWRPVCYLTPERDITKSTYPNFNTSLPEIDADHIKNSEKSLFYALFGENITGILGAQTTIAFGLSKDGFYTKYNFTEWTFALGLGHTPNETFSSLVIIVLCVGVGFPLLLVLIGGVYVSIKKFGRKDEPLLSN